MNEFGTIDLSLAQTSLSYNKKENDSNSEKRISYLFNFIAKIIFLLGFFLGLTSCMPENSNRALSLSGSGLISETDNEPIQQSFSGPRQLSIELKTDKSIELRWQHSGPDDVVFDILANGEVLKNSAVSQSSTSHMALIPLASLAHTSLVCFSIRAYYGSIDKFISTPQVCETVPTAKKDIPSPDTAAFRGNIYLVGASSIAEDPNTTGWGLGLQELLSGKIAVFNNARSGNSTKSYWDSHFSWRDEIKKGDLVLIQFGHNDQKSNLPAKFTSAIDGRSPSYKGYLKKYIDFVKSREATIVIFSPMERAIFDGDKLRYSHRTSDGDYVKAALESAKEQNVLFIDFNKMSRDTISGLGPEKINRYYLMKDIGRGHIDKTHLNRAGSKYFAELILGKLQEIIHFENF